MRKALIAMLVTAAPAYAQQAGGLSVGGAGLGPMPLQPEIAASAPLHQNLGDVRAINPARGREGIHQSAIAAIRGDSGYLGGFFRGQPMAASRQPPPEFAMPDFVTIVEAPFIQNNFGSPVAVETAGPATINAHESPVAVNSGPGKLEQKVDSAVNIATGTGNVAKQEVKR